MINYPHLGSLTSQMYLCFQFAGKTSCMQIESTPMSQLTTIMIKNCRTSTVDCKQSNSGCWWDFFKKLLATIWGGGSTSWTPFHFLGIYFMHANKIQRRKIEFLSCVIAGDWDVLGLQQRRNTSWKWWKDNYSNCTKWETTKGEECSKDGETNAKNTNRNKKMQKNHTGTRRTWVERSAARKERIWARSSFCHSCHRNNLFQSQNWSLFRFEIVKS